MSHLFINTATGEYPRHPGDVQLDPTAPWATVEETERPEAGPLQLVSEGEPELRDGTYFQTWVVNTLTQEEWDERSRNFASAKLARFGLTVDELRLLLGL